MLNNGFKEFNVQKVQNPNKCWRQIIVGPIKNIVEKFGPQNFGSQTIGGPKILEFNKIGVQEIIIGVQIIVIWKNLRSKII